MDVIPGDDILDYYSKADQSMKMVITDLLKEDTEGYLCARIDNVHMVTSSVSSSAMTAQVMLISLLREFTKDYGRIWLLQLLDALRKELKI